MHQQKMLNLLNKFSKDKWEHYALCLTLTCLLQVIFTWWLSAFIVLTIGIVKELDDLIFHRGQFEWLDILSDVMGIAVGILATFPM